MRFVVSDTALLKTLSPIHSIVPSNPMLPVLENFLFEAQDGKLTVTASNSQTRASIDMDVTTEENGEICIPAKMLMDTLKNLAEQPISISIANQDTNLVEIKAGEGVYKLAGDSADDFPPKAEIKDSKSIVLNSETLGDALTYTLFCASSDEMKPAMNGLLFQLRKDHINFVASDGHRLSRYRKSGLECAYEDDFIIDHKSLHILKNMLPKSTDIDVEYTDSNIIFRFNNYVIYCRLIDEKFPEYENVIPANNDIKTYVDREDMLKSLRRAIIYANKTTYQIKMSIKEDSLQLSSEDVHFSNEAVETLSCMHEGDAITIGFNARFVVDTISSFRDETVAFKFSDPSSGAIISPKEIEDGEDLIVLIMPIILNRD